MTTPIISVEPTATAEFDPSQLQRAQTRQRRRFFTRLGGFIRVTARRSLRKARKVRVSELPDEAAEAHREALEDFQNGYRESKPQLPDVISSPGKPPLLHSVLSPLKRLLIFRITPQVDGVVAGTVRARDAIAGDLESGEGDIKQERPFMRPALQAALPKLPSFYSQAVKS